MPSATGQLNMKLKLENTFRPEVKKAFNVILREFRLTVALTGMPPRLTNYKALWEVLLKNHYRRVQNKFKGVVKSQKQSAEADMLELALQAWRDGQAAGQTVIINDTTRVNMADAMNEVRTEAANAGKILSDQEMANLSAARLARKFKGRTQGIIITETQSAAEMAKFAEVEVISGLKPRVLGGRDIDTPTTKRWLTVGDRRVRPIHRLANGQVRKLREPYVVNGQLLMYPGDSSLGATVDNIANCRCISLYKFV